MHHPGVIDCYVHHHWSSQSELQGYMSPGWQVYLGTPGEIRGGRGQTSALPPPPFTHPTSDWLLDATPDDGSNPGSEPGLVVTQLLEPQGIERAVLGFDHGLIAPVALNPYLGLEVARAANEWSIERWLSGTDGRFYGLILVPNHLPDEAAKEIRARGTNERMVGVVMGGNGLGKTFGYPAYLPIYEAAAELDLPIVLHVGGETPPNTFTHPTAGGLPSTYAEVYALRGQSMMTHLGSLIIQGVLEKFPTLKIMIVGAGISWVPPYLWRLDTDFKAYGAREAPWLRQLPSEQFLERVRVTTYSLTAGPAAAELTTVVKTVPGLEDALCFASGYPRWDTDAANQVAQLFPDEWRPKILRENALGFFRWPTTSVNASATPVRQEAT